MDAREPYLIPLLVILVTRVVEWMLIPYASEDAYITFRYARNLAAGSGLVFNPDERVMGFSSPLWTLWMALGTLLTHAPVVWARGTSLLADLVTLIAGVSLLRRHASRVSAWSFAAFFSAWPYFSALTASGMETGIQLCLIVLTAALIDGRSRFTGVSLAALALIRPEGLVSAAVLAIGARARDRIVAGVFVIAAAVALYAYFGTIVPQSISAKSAIYGTPGPWTGRLWWDWISPVLLGRWPNIGDTVQFMPLLVVLSPALVLGVVELWRRRSTPLALAVAAALVVWLGYALLGVTYFWWYLAVPLGGILLAAAVGFPRIVRGPAIPIAISLMLLTVWSVSRHLYVGRSQQEIRSFAPAATYLRDKAAPGDKVMLEPIGLIGYMAPIEVIDEIGLVSPQVAARRMRGAGWYTDLVASERPRWLVVREGVLRTGSAFAGAGAPFRNLAERDSLLARFERVSPAGTGDQELAVLRRLPGR